jgi:hypothetical protein
MLIFPNSHKIHLSFESGFLGRLGVGLTLLGIILAAATPLWYRRISHAG